MGYEKLRPCIGISGISKETSAAAELGGILRAYDLSTHQWMVGYLATERILQGKETLHPQYPSLTALPDLFSHTTDSAMNTVHYATRNPDTISSQIDVLLTQTGLYEDGLCRGVQLNTQWPDPNEVSKIKDKFPNIMLALQLGREVLSNTDKQIADKVEEYRGRIDCLLIDPSMGKGMALDIPRAASLYNMLAQRHPELSVVFAGGITPESISSVVDEIESLVGSKNFGIDAQTGLLNKETHTLDIGKAKKYVENAATIFNKLT